MNSQQVVLVDTGVYRNYEVYYKYALTCTFDIRPRWCNVNRGHLRELKSYIDCMVIGVL